MKLVSRLAGVITLAGILTSSMLTSGCLAVAAGAGAAGAVAYVRGELDATLDASFDKASHATSRAVDQLQFARISETKDALLAVIVARNAADKKIQIRVKNSGENLVKLEIRVGVFGDEALSMAILDKIKANL